MKEHPETAQKIERAVRQNAGLRGSQIFEGGSETVSEAGEGETTEADGTVTPLAGGAARRGRRG